MMEQKIIVADLDSRTPMYSVVNEEGYTLGEKRIAHSPFYLEGVAEGQTMYLKPEYDKRGNRTGGRYGGWGDRLYRSNPHWLKYEVVGIVMFGGHLTFRVREEK